jgi:hypothetical protein
MKKSLLLFFALFLFGCEMFAQLPDTCWLEWQHWQQMFPPQSIREKHVQSATRAPEDINYTWTETFTFDDDGYVRHHTRRYNSSENATRDSDWYEHTANGRLTRMVDSTHAEKWMVSVWLFTYNAAGRMEAVTEHRDNDSGQVNQEVLLTYAGDGSLQKLEHKSYFTGGPNYTVGFSYTNGEYEIVRASSTKDETTEYTFGAGSRLLKEKGDTYSYAYEYNQAQQPVSILRKYNLIRLTRQKEKYLYNSDALIAQIKTRDQDYNFTYDYR